MKFSRIMALTVIFPWIWMFLEMYVPEAFAHQTCTIASVRVWATLWLDVLYSRLGVALLFLVSWCEVRFSLSESFTPLSSTRTFCLALDKTTHMKMWGIKHLMLCSSRSDGSWLVSNPEVFFFVHLIPQQANVYLLRNNILFLLLFLLFYPFIVTVHASIWSWWQ